MSGKLSLCAKACDDKSDLETEDEHIIFTINEPVETTDNDGAYLFAPETFITRSLVPSDDTLHIQTFMSECLKLSTSKKRTELSCFLCPETCQSFTDFYGHFNEAHDFTQGAALLSSIPSEYLNQMAKEIKRLKCTCKSFSCTTCEKNFSYILQLLQHVLLDHPTIYGSFPFFRTTQQSKAGKCKQCKILEKLCHADYDLFVRVLFDCVKYSNDSSKVMLMSWPLANCSEPCLWCAEEGEEVRISKHADRTDVAKREVVCNRITGEHSKAKMSMCICPILKCPDCPMTAGNFSDLCKHIRLNNHSSWHDMRIIWLKYKVIKENCPVCCFKYSYHCYIICPHCPHLVLESEKAAQAHMESKHKDPSRKAVALKCSCCNHYECFKCNTIYPTPQSLHRHLEQMDHATPKNLAAIPSMIQESVKSKKTCPRCSLQHSAINTGASRKECSCKRVECSICKTSFRKVSDLVDHAHKAQHTMSALDIQKEKEKLGCSVKTCQKCQNQVDKYCPLCHQRQGFLRHHLEAHHQDQQIMLLRSGSGALQEELHMPGWDEGRLAQYECNVCLMRFPCITRLRHHVRLNHLHSYITIFCLDLSNDSQQVKDFGSHEELMVLNIVDKIL